MISLEQVKLLESRVVRTIDYVHQLSEENAVLRSKLDGYRNRIDELEVLVKAFKEDQSSIEDGILSALDRLNQFENAVEKGLSEPLSIVPKIEMAAFLPPSQSADTIAIDFNSATPVAPRAVVESLSSVPAPAVMQDADLLDEEDGQFADNEAVEETADTPEGKAAELDIF